MTAQPSQSGTTYAVTPHSNPVSDTDRAALLAAPKFGTVFTDHMVRISWSEDKGWHNHRIEPYGPLTLDPATAVLHYAQEVFEGLKAFRHPDGSIWSFRPEANGARLAASAHRLSLPQLSVEDFLASIRELVAIDKAWVPDGEEMSLYLRPFAYAAERFIGVRAAKEVEYIVIASPVGPYFASGVKPVKIWIEQKYTRAARGGTGTAKCGGNYAASLLPQAEASARGCDQVAFLDAVTGTALEELGGMNIFIVKADGSVHTPALTGTILEGVTRSSIIQLLDERGLEVHEREILLTELVDGLRDGSISEVFACGTAAVVTPIGHFASDDFDLPVGNGEAGELTVDIRHQLTDVQWGKQPDTHGWLTRLA